METDTSMEALHRLESTPKESGSSINIKIIFILILVGTLGIGSGYLLSRTKKPSVTSAGTATSSNSSSVQKGLVMGSADMKTFKDTVEGMEKEGGIGGEGQYHLVRPGGDSQNVYLTSSLVDLSLFMNHKIKVWGQTNKAQHAGWLMDVGKVEVLE